MKLLSIRNLFTLGLLISLFACQEKTPADSIPEATTTIETLTLPPTTMSTSSPALIHTVSFWMNEPENAEHRSLMQSELEKLANNKLVQSGFWGTSSASDREVVDSSWDYSITFFFASEADEAAYQIDPDHNKFIDTCKHMWKSVRVQDMVNKTAQ